MCTVVDQRPEEVVFLQHWKSVQGPTLSQEIRALNAFRTGQKVVELCARPEIRRLPPLLDRNHDR